MSYYYLLDNGGKYSDYSVIGVIESDTEITVRDWKRLTERMKTWLDENIPEETWWANNFQIAEMLAAVGIKTVPLQITSFSCDPRRDAPDRGWAFSTDWDDVDI